MEKVSLGRIESFELKSISPNKRGAGRGWRESKQKSPRDIIMKFRYPEKSNLESFQREKHRLPPETSFTGTIDAGGQRTQAGKLGETLRLQILFSFQATHQVCQENNYGEDVPPTLSGEIT